MIGRPTEQNDHHSQKEFPLLFRVHCFVVLSVRVTLSVSFDLTCVVFDRECDS